MVARKCQSSSNSSDWKELWCRHYRNIIQKLWRDQFTLQRVRSPRHEFLKEVVAWFSSHATTLSSQMNWKKTGTYGSPYSQECATTHQTSPVRLSARARSCNNSTSVRPWLNPSSHVPLSPNMQDHVAMMLYGWEAITTGSAARRPTARFMIYRTCNACILIQLRTDCLKTRISASPRVPIANRSAVTFPSTVVVVSIMG